MTKYRVALAAFWLTLGMAIVLFLMGLSGSVDPVNYTLAALAFWALSYGLHRLAKRFKGPDQAP